MREGKDSGEKTRTRKRYCLRQNPKFVAEHALRHRECLAQRAEKNLKERSNVLHEYDGVVGLSEAPSS